MGRDPRRATEDRTVFFDSGAEILREFGLPPDGVHYRRLVEGFKRLFGSTIYFGTDEVASRNAVWDFRRFHFFDQLRVWCARGHEADAADAVAENAITLSEPFWQEIQAHPIPVDLAAVRAPAHNPGCLDFYMWLTWRCFTAKRAEAIPLFGSAGLAGQLGVPEYSRERNFRKRVRAWLVVVRLHWPDCPARLSPHGEALTIGPATAICSGSSA